MKAMILCLLSIGLLFCIRERDAEIRMLRDQHEQLELRNWNLVYDARSPQLFHLDKLGLDTLDEAEVQAIVWFSGQTQTGATARCWWYGTPAEESCTAVVHLDSGANASVTCTRDGPTHRWCSRAMMP